MNNKRLIYLTLTVVTLSIGVIIGTIVSGGVKATTSEQKPAVIAIPDPVAMSNSFSSIASQLEPAVVNIEVEITPPPIPQRRQSGGGRGGGRGGNAAPDPTNPLDNLFGGIFGGATPNLEPPEPQKATGTGFIVDKAGYILTNHHVVENATRITVKLADKNDYGARLIGSDSYTDLAVIKIDVGKDLQTARFGNSDAVKTGDWVLAVGSPFGFDHTVTSGIISAKGRSADDLNGGGGGPVSGGSVFQSFLQTDAAINPGNSGGPLVNMAGEVIGINTAIVSETNSFAGLGFALPSNIAIKVYNQLAQTGKVVRGSIGIGYAADIETLHAFGVNEGVVVTSVIVGKPAAQAGLHDGDVITHIDGQKITSGPMLLDLIASTAVDRSIQIRILRDGRDQTIPVTIGDRERVIGGESASNNAPADVIVPAIAPEKILGIVVKAIPQDIVKKFALSGVAVSAIEKGSIGADVFGGTRTEGGTAPPLIIDSVVTDGRTSELRGPGDFDRAVAGLKRGANVAFGVYLPTGRSTSLLDVKYDHTYLSFKMP